MLWAVMPKFCVEKIISLLFLLIGGSTGLSKWQLIGCILIIEPNILGSVCPVILRGLPTLATWAVARCTAHSYIYWSLTWTLNSKYIWLYVVKPSGTPSWTLLAMSSQWWFSLGSAKAQAGTCFICMCMALRSYRQSRNYASAWVFLLSGCSHLIMPSL